MIILRIAICEDDATMQEKLREAIEDWAESRKMKVDVICYPSAEAFVFAWPGISFDLAFLDIQMKNMSGIELAKFIRKTDSNMLLVFVTSFKQYALDGYDVNAMHYLIKPLSLAKLLPILDRARVIWTSHRDAAMIVSNEAGQSTLPYGDIFYISTSSHIASVHTGNSVYELRKPMNELIEMLPDYFLMCHRSYIVNIFKVYCIYKDSLLLSNEVSLPVSRKKSKALHDAFVRLHTGR